jgi:hypothetical protein
MSFLVNSGRRGTILRSIGFGYFRMPAMRWLRTSTAAVIVSLSILAASCSGTSATYLTSTSTHTFLKVPSDWKVFNQSTIRSEVKSGSTPPFPFLAAFDADPKPSLNHNFSDAKYPWGLVRVRDLGEAEHDTFSLASLRNEVVKVDDVEQQDANAVQVLGTPKLLTHQGLRGTKLEYSIHLNGEDFTVSQTGYVDQPTQRVWLLILGCETACFQRNAAAIHRVADSWIVRGS